MSATPDSTPLNTALGDGLKEALSQSAEGVAEAAGTTSSTLTGKKPGSVGQKVALISAGIQLFRRYPVATLCVAGLAVAIYIMRRNDPSKRTVH